MRAFFQLACCLLLAACEPSWQPNFELFTIKKGNHYSTKAVQLLQSDQLTFDAIFDESARYEALEEENQWDTNKLLGFSDCNSHHHKNSARFGWRWLDDQLEILAYCYSNGSRVIQPIGTVNIGESNTYQLQITDNQYIFSLQGYPQVRIKRAEICTRGFYYMLFPYFGGDEVAPHDIHIQIRMIQG